MDSPLLIRRVKCFSLLGSYFGHVWNGDCILEMGRTCWGDCYWVLKISNVLAGACDLLIYEGKNEVANDAKSRFSLQKSVRMIMFVPLLYLVPYRYYPGITSVMPWAVGCLTRENTHECRAFFVDLFHFLLLLVTFFTARKFCKLLFIVERGKVCYFLLLFLLLVIFINYFLLLRRARVHILFIVQRGKGCTLNFFLLFFYCWGGGGWRLMFFFPPSLEMWKEEGGKGLEMFFSLWRS